MEKRALCHVCFLVLDKKQARKLVRVLQKDWKYQCSKLSASSLGPAIYAANETGTYGVGSAQFWWGRVAGLLGRTMVRLGLTLWVLTYVDHDLFVLQRDSAPLHAGAILLFLCVLRLPIAWKKLLSLIHI